MFRPHLASNEGMVFLFEDVGFHPFWMKDTLIPLDMIWLDAGRRVVDIAESVPPCQAEPCPTYAPSGHALYVLEAVAGFASQHGLKRGDTVTFNGIGRARTPR